MSRASLFRGTERSRRGSTFAAALALVLLIFMMLTVAIARVAGTYARVSLRHQQTRALFLAEAGIQKAAYSLMGDRAYTGERRTKLAGGSFDVKVSPGRGGYVVTATGYANSPFRAKPRKTVRAVVRVSGKSFAVSDWREDP